MANLYLLFQKEPFAGYSFAWSQTLVGYEERLYFARTASQGKKPAMERTKFSEYLHLRVRRSNLSEPARDLLLCDFTAEDFREAKDSSDACKRLAIIRSADQFVLLIDGEKVSNTKDRQSAKNDTMTLLRNCLDTGMLGRTSAVDVLFTKWDIIESHEDRAEIINFADHVEEEFHRRFSNRVRQLRVGRVAAHPSEADLPMGFGLSDFFPSWVDAARSKAPVLRAPLVEPPALAEYDRYLRRQVPELFREV